MLAARIRVKGGRELLRGCELRVASYGLRVFFGSPQNSAFQELEIIGILLFKLVL